MNQTVTYIPFISTRVARLLSDPHTTETDIPWDEVTNEHVAGYIRRTFFGPEKAMNIPPGNITPVPSYIPPPRLRNGYASGIKPMETHDDLHEHNPLLITSAYIGASGVSITLENANKARGFDPANPVTEEDIFMPEHGIENIGFRVNIAAEGTIGPGVITFNYNRRDTAATFICWAPELSESTLESALLSGYKLLAYCVPK